MIFTQEIFYISYSMLKIHIYYSFTQEILYISIFKKYIYTIHQRDTLYQLFNVKRYKYAIHPMDTLYQLFNVKDTNILFTQGISYISYSMLKIHTYILFIHPRDTLYHYSMLRKLIYYTPKRYSISTIQC